MEKLILREINSNNLIVCYIYYSLKRTFTKTVFGNITKVKTFIILRKKELYCFSFK